MMEKVILSMNESILMLFHPLLIINLSFSRRPAIGVILCFIQLHVFGYCWCCFLVDKVYFSNVCAVQLSDALHISCQYVLLGHALIQINI